MIDDEPGPRATDELREEHELIRRGLHLLEQAGRRLVAGARVPEAAMEGLVSVLRRFVDQYHHGKEEMLLYPRMRARGLPPDGRLRELVAAHIEGHDYLGALADLSSQADRAAAALLYVQVTREHLAAEEETVFPVADRMLSAAEQAELARAYAETEAAAFGPAFRAGVARELDRLEALLG
jgi:hemerythrin-like domain-containing protein